jgi:hypothetical protein
MLIRLLMALAALVPLPTEPPVSLADLDILPPAAIISDALDAASRAVEYAEKRASIEPGNAAEWGTVLSAARWHQSAWSLLWQARGDYGEGWIVSDESRLDALRGLRRHVGYHWYYSGWMPPPVPAGWLPEVH